MDQSLQMLWENEIIELMDGLGWNLGKNDDDFLCFFIPTENGFRWQRDYNKKTRKFIQYNVNQKFRTNSPKEENE